MIHKHHIYTFGITTPPPAGVVKGTLLENVNIVFLVSRGHLDEDLTFCYCVQ